MASEQANKTGQETHRRGWWVVVNAGECGWEADLWRFGGGRWYRYTPVLF